MILRLITWLVLVSFSIAQEDLILKTSFGSVQGYESIATDGTRVRIFKSVPFAAPPVGDLRWSLPEYPKRWEGVREGRNYSAACMSNSTTTRSPQPWVDEDCLYLNVFTHGECSTHNKCPIIVYYHGGGMNYDSATYFDDQSIIDTYASQGVTLIIPAFRLGFTGQFSLGDDQELIPSNLGVYDALHALKFIHKEAAAFSGDPDSITVMGHSFGGGLSILLAFSPARKLQVSIHQFIMMSPGLYFDPPVANEKLSEEMVTRAGCSSLSKRVILSCMKKKSGVELLAIQREMEEEGNKTGEKKIFGGVVMRPPLFPFKSIPDMLNSPPNANILIGSTTGELDDDPIGPSGSFGAGVLVGIKNTMELGQLYLNQTQSGLNNQTHKPNSQAIYVAVYTTAKAVMEKGHKVFLYSFDQPTHNLHTQDLSYLMGIHGFERDDNEKEIAKFYPHLFTNFSKFGEPSPEWKPMNFKDRYYSIKVNLTTGRMPELRDFYEKETIDFWVRKAPKIDKMITVSKVAGTKMQWDKVSEGFRDLSIENDEVENETLVPVVIVQSSYFLCFFLLCGVFLLGVALSRCLLSDSKAREEKTWILSPDGMRKPPPYAEQLF